MKIELKGLRVYERMSDETTAFDGTLYVDGKKVGSASNRGFGGCNEIDVKNEVRTKMEEWAKAQPPVTSSIEGAEALAMDLDLYISMLVERTHTQAKVKRLIKDRILIGNAQGQLLQTSKVTPEQRAAFKPGPGEQVLTEQQAVALLMKDAT
jgi:hypothetical protein